MKKLLGIIVLGLLLSGNAYSFTKKLKSKDHGALTISTVCIDGYKFVVTNDYANSRGVAKYNDDPVSVSVSVNTTQFMEVKNGIMVPAKC